MRPEPFTSGKIAAIIDMISALMRNALGIVPYSEPEFGASPVGGSLGESPLSSEPNAIRSVGFAGSPVTAKQVDA